MPATAIDPKRNLHQCGESAHGLCWINLAAICQTPANHILACALNDWIGCARGDSLENRAAMCAVQAQGRCQEATARGARQDATNDAARSCSNSRSASHQRGCKQVGKAQSVQLRTIREEGSNLHHTHAMKSAAMDWRHAEDASIDTEQMPHWSRS